MKAKIAVAVGVFTWVGFGVASLLLPTFSEQAKFCAIIFGGVGLLAVTCIGIYSVWAFMDTFKK